MAEDKCTCDECEGMEHTCPYSEEIHGDNETLCSCCEYCEYQCGQDI